MISLSLLLFVLAADGPAAGPAPAAPPTEAHVQTTAEWLAACQDDEARCQAELGRSVVNRARMAGDYGCADITDDRIYLATTKWIAKHGKEVNDLPAKEGLTKATEAVWPCLKPKFQGRIP